MSATNIETMQRPSAAPDGMTEAEWQVRCDVAACYQLLDLYGMSDLIANHVSAVIPGPEHHFLMHQFGMLYDQVTASSLVKMDRDGNVIGSGYPNRGGVGLHGGIHQLRPDLNCVLHTHTAANNAVSMLQEGLIPAHQNAMVLLSFIGYHDYEGVAGSGASDECARIVESLGSHHRIVIMRNHGALTVGRSIAEAFVWMYRFESACRFLVQGLSCGRPLNPVSEADIERTKQAGRKLFGPGGGAEVGSLEWPSLLRKLEAERGTSYRS
ncbi:class II aldolase/adducin family protein [Sphingomonas sp. MG17]|uniref:Class II aldolase/adducin family protein n=1 Tax=Sphingomonas tagetis TaxID=2949092 RepID=A0A9X2HHL4_9SPHN|nr:class II aldolase/adducin family protein [Sphingomonas tagetis]MCP3731356.1 class II aldolase/adducin family protein [Sphingomonas tagetis]